MSRCLTLLHLQKSFSKYIQIHSLRWVGHRQISLSAPIQPATDTTTCDDLHHLVIHRTIQVGIVTSGGCVLQN